MTFIGAGMEDFYRWKNGGFLCVEKCRTFVCGGIEDFYRSRNGGL